VRTTVGRSDKRKQRRSCCVISLWKILKKSSSISSGVFRLDCVTIMTIAHQRFLNWSKLIISQKIHPLCPPVVKEKGCKVLPMTKRMCNLRNYNPTNCCKRLPDRIWEFRTEMCSKQWVEATRRRPLRFATQSQRKLKQFPPSEFRLRCTVCADRAEILPQPFHFSVYPDWTLQFPMVQRP